MVQQTATRFAFLLFLFAAWNGPAVAQGVDAEQAGSARVDSTVFVVSSPGAQTQMMAMVLANQVQAKGASVRVLLCDEAGTLAVKGASFPVFRPVDRTPQQLLQSLIGKGARVDVCAIFLPNTGYEKADLLDGVGQARPGPEAEDMLNPNIRYFKF